MIIQKFINRDKELKALYKIINAKKFEFIVVYGRRRIGKTELILEATKESRRFYYLGIGEKNLERFYELCLQHYPEAVRLKADWEILFDFLKDKVDVIIIDEFQNLIQENENILNILQAVIDTTLKKTKIKLFTVGSSISIMTSKILNYKSPLYGRRTGSINLKGISFFDLIKFFPKTDIEKLIEIYGFSDGIPFYIVKINKEFWLWLKEEIKEEKSFLKDEVDFLMLYEFTDISTYKLILEAIANSKTKLNEIKDYIKVKRTDISPYLKNLIEVGMVKRIVPITENIKSRFGRYYLSDNFLKFWFRYIYPNLSAVEEGIFKTSIIKEDYKSYLGYIFEDISRQYLIKWPKFFFSFTNIGKWWHKDKEIDIVALNEKSKEILFCECKFSNNVDAEVILNELKEKAHYVEWNGNKRKEYYAIFAKSFKKKFKKEGIILIDFNDIKSLLN